MPTSIITTEDLMEFKIDLLEKIKDLLSTQPEHTSKKWLKSAQVMDLLKISAGTLQNFRINGTLPYSKVGGIIYYESGDIQKVMDDNRVHHKFE